MAAANIYFIPMQLHLKAMTEYEVAEKELIVEGVLSIQSGDNPRVLAEKLWSFVPPSLRAESSAEGEPAAQAAA